MHWLPVILILPYFFLFLVFYRNLLKIKHFKVTTDPDIFVSVVVACRNEQDKLPFLLNWLAEQNYTKELYEIVIVNDNSTDGTFEIASSFNKCSNITTINNKGTGKKQAIRTGIKASSGSLIITTDADCRMGKSWIRTIASFYEKHKPSMIICPVQVEQRSSFFGRFQELEFLSLQGITAASVLAGKSTMCNGANLSFTREVYLNHSNDLHDQISSGDDIFLLHSLKQELNAKILWLESTDSLVTTNSSETVKSFLKQRKRWISKGMAYSDGFTITLGIVTFVTILLQLSVLVTGFFNPLFFIVFTVIFLLKSVPDFLILRNTTIRYGKKYLMSWFIPAQIVYPFYVLSVFIYSLISPENR